MLHDPKSKPALNELQGDSPLNSLARRYYVPLLSFFRKRTRMVRRQIVNYVTSTTPSVPTTPNTLQSRDRWCMKSRPKLAVTGSSARYHFPAAFWGPRGPRSYLATLIRAIALSASLLLAAVAMAQTPIQPSAPQTETKLDTITVNAKRERAILERRVDKFVYGITVTPFEDSIARWQMRTPICPLVAGLPQDDGEYMLSRLSQIATAAGASLAPASCQPNFYVIVTSVPGELIAAWSKRNHFLFGNAGGTKIRRFTTVSTPVRVWYNVQLTDRDGIPCTVRFGIPLCPADGHFAFGTVRDLASVIMLIDARLAKGISFGQLSAYVAMNGLAEIRAPAKVGDAPSILHLFTDPKSAPPLGLSAWDAAYLKAIYHTQQDDKTQLLAVKESMVNDVAP